MLNGTIIGEDDKEHEISDEALAAVNYQKTILSEAIKDLDAQHSKTKMFLYGSIALNIGLIAYCAMKK